MEFDNLNGFLIEKGDKLFDTSNRSLKYGDGVFETMKLVNGKIMFWDDHYNRLSKSMKHFKIDESGKDKAFWEAEIEKVIVKNYYKDAKLRLIVFRDGPGLYTPMSSRCGFVLEGIRYDRPDYEFDTKGISLDVFTGDYKAISPLSNFKSTSAALFVLASIYKKEKKYGDVIVLNTAQRVCESTCSNVFIKLNDQIITPSLAEGCLNGVSRLQVINYFKHKNVEIIESEITINDLEEASEIFLTNTISGAQGVSAFKGKKLDLTLSKEVQKYFSQLVSE